jgi:hypothetical protein
MQQRHYGETRLYRRARSVLSRLKHLPRVAWMAIGMAAMLVLVPTGAAAKALKFTGIQGTSGNQADVTGARQLLTTEAAPASFSMQQGVVQSYAGSDCEVVATAPAGQALVVKSVDINAFDVMLPNPIPSSPPGASATAFMELLAEAAGAPCNVGGSVALAGEPAVVAVGNTTVSFEPGFVLPAGYQLTAVAFSFDADVFTNGYPIPASSAPSVPAARVHGPNARLKSAIDRYKATHK